MGNRVRLRTHIDGVCLERDTIPKRVQSAVIARLKIMAGEKIEEKRIPQDGRIKLKVDDKTVPFRFAVCPPDHVDAARLRIFPPPRPPLSPPTPRPYPNIHPAF